MTARTLTLLTILVGLGCGGGQGPYAPSAISQWNDTALEAIRQAKPGPPMAARMLAILHTCTFDAWAAYDASAVGTRLGDSLRRPLAERTSANKNKAVSYAAYRALVDLFPAQKALFDAQMATMGFDGNDDSDDPATASGVGNIAAAAVLTFRHSDGSNQLGNLHPGAYSDYTGYVPINDPDHISDPDRWQPLRVSDGHGGFAVQTYIGPHWGLVTPFALSSGSQFRPAAPARYGTPEYKEQAQEIVDIYAHLTDDMKMTAEYWADGPRSELPPGHWCLLGQFVSRRDGHDLDEDVKMFFVLSNALMDAGIACWDAKRAYDSIRPISAIHYLYQGQLIQSWGGPFQGTVTMPGEYFGTFQSPTFVTPAFPEFFSGHSTFSAAAAEVLKRFTHAERFGEAVTFKKGSSLIEPDLVPAQDITHTWVTFIDAANEAGMSRRYGGIHFRNGDLTGRTVGREVGAVVWEKAAGYINGTALPP